MQYDRLNLTYFAQQRARIDSLKSRISQRENALSQGRSIPEGADLTLGTGRRLSMAVMFIDISGFSSMNSLTAAEQHTMLNALNLFFTSLTKIASDYGGVVEKNTGDGLLIYFEDGGGEPAAPGTVRAVSCALTMFAVSEEFIAPAAANLGIPNFSFRVSVEYGEVTIANLGMPRGFNSYVAIGSVANFAAKMLSKAKAGDLVIGGRAKIQLPVSWQEEFSELLEGPTGWVYANTEIPYPLFRYFGRWA